MRTTNETGTQDTRRCVDGYARTSEQSVQRTLTRRLTDEANSPWRRYVIEDITIRKVAPKTQHGLRARVKNLQAEAVRANLENRLPRFADPAQVGA